MTNSISQSETHSFYLRHNYNLRPEPGVPIHYSDWEPFSVDETNEIVKNENPQQKAIEILHEKYIGNIYHSFCSNWELLEVKDTAYNEIDVETFGKVFAHTKHETLSNRFYEYSLTEEEIANTLDHRSDMEQIAKEKHKEYLLSIKPETLMGFEEGYTRKPEPTEPTEKKGNWFSKLFS